MTRIVEGVMTNLLHRGPAVALAVILVGGVAAHRIRAATPDLQLLEFGNQALAQGDFMMGAMYLFAYTQRNPADLQGNPVHAAQVYNAIEAARQAARSYIARVQELERENMDLRKKAGVGGLRPPPPRPELPQRVDPPPPPPAGQPLVCRGGGRIGIYLLAEGYGVGTTSLSFEFQRAAAPGAASLEPGECAWLDRPVAPGEPNRVCDHIEAATLDVRMAVDDRMVRGVSSASAPYLPRLVLGEEPVTFRVVDNGQGCLVGAEAPAPARGRGRGRGRAL
jgi:hypothetical protein